MAKKIIGFIKLQIPAGKANPSPPIGPAIQSAAEDDLYALDAMRRGAVDDDAHQKPALHRRRHAQLHWPIREHLGRIHRERAEVLVNAPEALESFLERGRTGRRREVIRDEPAQRCLVTGVDGLDQLRQHPRNAGRGRYTTRPSPPLSYARAYEVSSAGISSNPSYTRSPSMVESKITHRACTEGSIMESFHSFWTPS